MIRILSAMKFAAERHRRQRRKNSDATPYINHPIEVTEILARVGGISDEDVLIAGLLHDTVEDTETTIEELVTRFGERVGQIVRECTDDKRLEKSQRKHLQIVNAPHKSPEAKCVKLADKSSNLASILVDPPAGWSLQRQLEYFAWAEQVIHGLRGVNAGLDSHVLELLSRGREQLSAKQIAAKQIAANESPAPPRD